MTGTYVTAVGVGGQGTNITLTGELEVGEMTRLYVQEKAIGIFKREMKENNRFIRETYNVVPDDSRAEQHNYTTFLLALLSFWHSEGCPPLFRRGAENFQKVYIHELQAEK